MEQCLKMQRDEIVGLRKAGHRGPIGVLWDSIAQTPTKAELAGEYDDHTMAAAARFPMATVVGVLWPSAAAPAGLTLTCDPRTAGSIGQ
jgi:hypothetical protein